MVKMWFIFDQFRRIIIMNESKLILSLQIKVLKIRDFRDDFQNWTFLIGFLAC